MMKKTMLLLSMSVVVLVVALWFVVSHIVFRIQHTVPAQSVTSSPTHISSTTTASLGIGTTTAGTATSSTATLSATKINQLVITYPEFVTIDPHAPNTLVWKQDKTRMVFDDGVFDKDFANQLEHPDLEDQLSQAYVKGSEITIRPDFDPGRICFLPFFEKMYGASEAQVKANLETVYWLPKHGNVPLLVTRVNGVSQKLQAVSNELDALLEEPGNRDLLKYLQNPAGTFYWRDVAGTDRLSAHSFGIAIDINSTYSNYWRWASDGGATYHNRIPLQIVAVFEKYGFIWGGKWSHYDTMHFEYRPELLVGQ